MINIENLSIESLLPSNLKLDDDILAAAKSLDMRKDLVEGVKRCLILVDLKNQTDEVINALAYSFHVDFYDEALPKEKKIKLIENAIRWHRRKGSAKVVEELVTAAFDESKVKEWFDYDGEPYMFKITTTDRMTDYEKIKSLILAVDSMKNERSHLECLEILRGNEGGVRVGQVVKKTLKLQMPMRTTQDVYKNEGTVKLGQVYKKKTCQGLSVKTTNEKYCMNSSLKAMVFMRIIKFKKMGGM